PPRPPWHTLLRRIRVTPGDGVEAHPPPPQAPPRPSAPPPPPRHFHFESAHAMLLGLAGHILARHLGRIRRRFARALETHSPGRRPGDRIALGVGNRDHRVIE